MERREGKNLVLDETTILSDEDDRRLGGANEKAEAERVDAERIKKIKRIMPETKRLPISRQRRIISVF